MRSPQGNWQADSSASQLAVGRMNGASIGRSQERTERSKYQHLLHQNLIYGQQIAGMLVEAGLP